jgi:hypothetical protein
VIIRVVFRVQGLGFSVFSGFRVGEPHVHWYTMSKQTRNKLHAREEDEFRLSCTASWRVQQVLTLIHFSAQPEPFFTTPNCPLIPLNHPLNNP